MPRSGSDSEDSDIEGNEFDGQSPASFAAPPSPTIFQTNPIMQTSSSTRSPSRDSGTAEVAPPSNSRKTRYLEKEEVDLQQRLGELSERLGPYHPAYLDTLARLVRTHMDQGRYRIAEQECAQLVQRSKMAFGDDIMTTKKSLVKVLCGQKRYIEAETLGREIMAVSEKVFGLEDIQTSRGMGHMGQVYRDQDRLDEAQTMFEKAFTVATKRFGAEHHITKLCLSDTVSILQRKEIPTGVFSEPDVIGWDGMLWTTTGFP